MATPPGDPRSHPLEPVLRDVEAELRRRLREACDAEARGISTDSAAEIRRLEDSLLAAAVAAEQTIALRRRMGEQTAANSGVQAATTSADTVCTPNDAPEPVVRVREFRDSSGQLWRAWPVTPGQARQGRSARQYLGDFHKGWICFEALESSARRRLPSQPARWGELPDSELVQLLEQAINAPTRKPRREATDTPAPPVH